MRADLDAFLAWPGGPAGAATSDGKRAITGEAGKERGKKCLMRGFPWLGKESVRMGVRVE